MRTPEQEEIARALRGLVPDRGSARAAAEGGSGFDAHAWESLIELGLIGVVLDPESGGSGATVAEELLVIETLAEQVVPVPLTAVYAASHILAEANSAAGQELAAQFSSGTRVIGAILSASSGSDAGIALQKADDDQIGTLSGLITDALAGECFDGGLAWADGAWWYVDLRDERVERSELQGIDPTRRLTTIAFRKVPVRRVSDLPAEQVDRLAWLFTAAESTGVAAAALELARSYALERRQFGETIGRFQAIKHKLADCLVEVEGARSSLFGAVEAMREGRLDERPARMAKTVATAAAVKVAFEAIQIHGAIGNTWEHDLHLLLRRAKFCQLVLGTSDQHAEALTTSLMTEVAPTRGGSGPGWEAQLSLSEDEVAFLQEFRAWLDAAAPKERVKAIRSGGLGARREWQAEMADAGWAGIHWPKAYGGRDATFVEQVLYHSELASRGFPGLVGNRGLSLVGPTLIVHGTPDQQARYLEATRRADILWASGLSEPEAGSDLASLRTKGTIDGEELVITGQKTWTSHADFTEMMFTLVRTGPMVPKHSGISCVLVPLNSPGVTIRPIKRMHGVAEFAEVFLDEVRVPLSNVIGQVDHGWHVARTTLSHEHLTNFLGAQLRNAFFVEGLVAQLRQTEANQGGIESSLRRRLTQAWINTQILRLHGLRNIAVMSEKGEPGAEGSILKMFGQEEERRLFELALDLKGIGGLTARREINNFLSARAATVGGGTSEIHRNKVAERVLGMPRDPWAD